jgi:carotenoid cleavage dioxygenase-like enzyme
VNDEGQTVIILFGCAQTRINIDFDDEHPFLAGKQAPKLSKFTFNLSTGEASWKILNDEICMEFPVIDQNLIGLKQRYTYLALFATKVPESREG